MEKVVADGLLSYSGLKKKAWKLKKEVRKFEEME